MNRKARIEAILEARIAAQDARRLLRRSKPNRRFFQEAISFSRSDLLRHVEADAIRNSARDGIEALDAQEMHEAEGAVRRIKSALRDALDYELAPEEPPTIKPVIKQTPCGDGLDDLRRILAAHFPRPAAR